MRSHTAGSGPDAGDCGGSEPDSSGLHTGKCERQGLLLNNGTVAFKNVRYSQLTLGRSAFDLIDIQGMVTAVHSGGLYRVSVTPVTRFWRS